MSLYDIATKYNGPLAAAQAHIHDDRYDMVECGTAGRSKLDLSGWLRSCIIASTHAMCMSSANELV